MQVESVSVDDLSEDPANVRKHGDRNIESIVASLRRFGQQKPIIVDAAGVVRAGNGTLAAAKSLGWKTIDVVFTSLEGSDATAYAIADNRTAELAEWDDLSLASTLESLYLEDETFLDSVGFSDDELQLLLAEVRNPVAEDEEKPLPSVPDNPIAKAGQIWHLGPHRLMCGDCRKEQDVSMLFAGSKLQVAITSPPYADRRKYDESTGFKPIPPEEYVQWFDAVQSNVAAHMAEDGSWFVNIKEHCTDGQRELYVKDLTLAHVRQWSWMLVEEYVWSHGGTPKAVINRFKNAWEPVFHFTKARNHKFRPESVRHASKSIPDWNGGHPCDSWNQGGGDGVYSTDRKRKLTQAEKQGKTGALADENNNNPATKAGLAYPSNVLSFGKNREALGHAAAYPLDLPTFFIKVCSDPGDIVFDPFMGSGTTMIAAHKTDRVGYGMEISPAYCDIIIKRWENLTDEKAVCHEATGAVA